MSWAAWEWDWQSAERADDAPVALALVGAAGALARITAVFLDQCEDCEALLAAHQTELDRIVSGELDETKLRLGDAVLDVSAVVGTDGTRYALLSIDCPTPGANEPTPFDEAVAASRAIVWVKDLDGRYRRVNQRFEDQLGTAAEHVTGMMEAELEPGQTIEGLRQGSASEPLELEYIVPPADGRPGFTVLRFALRDANGEPVAVCGVAAPLAEAGTAHGECGRLMRAERWGRTDQAEAREELLREWGLAAAGDAAHPVARHVAAAAEPAGETDGEQFTALAAELDAALATSARLDRELAEERRQVLALREASVMAARRAHDLLQEVRKERDRSAELEEAIARVETSLRELEAERDQERWRAEKAQAAAAEAVAAEQEKVQALTAQLTAAANEIERLRAAAAEAPTPDDLEAERARAHEATLAVERAESDLATTQAALAKEQRTVQTLRAEVRAAEEEAGRARRAAAEAIAQAPSQDELDEERRRAEKANAALAKARAHAEQAQAEKQATVAQVHAELRRTRADAAESAAALQTERQALESARAELAAMRDELERVHLTPATSNQDEALSQALDELRRVRAEATAATTALSTQQATSEMLRGELSTVREELVRLQEAATSANDVSARAEVEYERTRAEQAERAADEQRTRADQAERAAHEQRTRAEQAERAAQEQRTRAEEAIQELRRQVELAGAAAAQAKGDASAAAGRADAERHTIEALRAEVDAARAEADATRAEIEAVHHELDASRRELEQLRQRAADHAAAIAKPTPPVEAPAPAGKPAAARKPAPAENHAPAEEPAPAAEPAPAKDPAPAVKAAASAEKGAANEKPAAAVKPARTAKPAGAARTAGGAPKWDAQSQRALSAALMHVSDWRAALKQTVDVLGEKGGWDAVVAWHLEERRRNMTCAATWTPPGVDLKAFETQMWKHRLNGAAAAAADGGEGAARYVLDLESAEDSHHRAAAAAGMRSSVLVAIADGTKALGVVELFSTRAEQPSDDLLLALEATALQLGGVAHQLKTAGSHHWHMGRL